MAKRWWVCAGCSTRNERVKQKCSNSNCNRSRPKARTPKHAVTLQEDSYAEYVRIAQTIHGVEDESCCVCRRPRSQERRHDRDHSHAKGDPAFGKPRGLACVRCNKLMPVLMTTDQAQAIADYLRRVDNYYATA